MAFSSLRPITEYNQSSAVDFNAFQSKRKDDTQDIYLDCLGLDNDVRIVLEGMRKIMINVSDGIKCPCAV